jgi:hypothetical protein
MGLAWRQPPRSRHRQRPRSLTTRDNGDTRPGHIPTPPRPRPDRARPALPQELAATFRNRVKCWIHWRFCGPTGCNRTERVANGAHRDVENPWTMFSTRSVGGPDGAFSMHRSPAIIPLSRVFAGPELRTALMADASADFAPPAGHQANRDLRGFLRMGCGRKQHDA